MNLTPIFLAGLALAIPVHADAQSAADGMPKEPVSAGAIIMPPVTDPGMTRPAPAQMDPGSLHEAPLPNHPDNRAFTPRSSGDGATQGDSDAGIAGDVLVKPAAPRAPARGKASRQDSCQGPDRLCRQQNAR